MSLPVVALTSFVIYLALFGWLGYRRGTLREMIVAISALAGMIILQLRGDVVVSMANLMGAGIQFAISGGFNGSQEEALAAIMKAPELVPPEAETAFLYLVWVIGFIFVYLLTAWLVKDANSKNNGWAVLLGVANAFFFAIVFLPAIATLFNLPYTIPEAENFFDLVAIVGRGLALIWAGIAAVWEMILPFGPTGIFILITGILVLAAFSIRVARSKS